MMDALEEKIRERFSEVTHFRSWREQIPENDFQYSKLIEFVGSVDGLSLLDVGCGKGAFARRLADAGANVSGIDITDEFVETAARNVPAARFRVASATDMPFESDSFDVAFCFEVLEHVPDTERAISEMVRVLKPRGRLLIIDKNILATHPRYCVPIALYKRYMELRDRWMYPRDFPFREKWFRPARVLNLLRERCSTATLEYLRGRRENRLRGLLRVFPFLSMDVAWKGIK